MSGVKTRKVIYIAGGMLILLGFIPKISSLTTIIPEAVLGGAMIAMFGMIISQGIKMLSAIISDSQSPGNAMIIACSIGIGLGVTVVPDLFHSLPDSIQILTSNGIVAGSFTAIVLNILFNMIPTRNKG